MRAGLQRGLTPLGTGPVIAEITDADPGSRGQRIAGGRVFRS